MAIYTKTGDQGETSLANGQRVAKTDARIEAYGTVDELNSWIGALRAELHKGETCLHSDGQAIETQLGWIQNKLFNLGALLSEASGEWIQEADVAQLEAWIDRWQAATPKQHAFVLPAGGEAVCRCHVCRTVCRRAERRMIVLGSDGDALRWVNRLSDYLFVLARFVGFAQGEKETFWEQ